MLTIRLTRKGKKNQPFFRVVVVDKRRSSKGGRAVEEVGYVDPLTKRKSFKKERILHWISVGAKPSATIHNLLVAEKIVEAPKVKVFNVSKKAKAEASKAAEAKSAPEAAAPAEAPASDSAPETEVAPEATSETKEEKPAEAPAEEKSA